MYDPLPDTPTTPKRAGCRCDLCGKELTGSHHTAIHIIDHYEINHREQEQAA